MSPEDPPNSQELKAVCDSITKEWTKIAIEEGFPPPQAERLAQKFVEPVLSKSSSQEQPSQ
jgi:hypothetical protein